MNFPILAIEQADPADLMARWLAACADVTTLVGERIRPDALEQGDALPALRYETLSCDDQEHLAGPQGEAQSRIQFDCYAATRREANRLAKLVHAALRALDGRTLGAAGGLQVKFWEITRDSNYTRTDPGPPGAAQPRYRRVMDFLVTCDELAPELAAAPLE